MSKITLSTIKKFIKNENLYIKTKSDFNPMIDSIEIVKSEFKKVVPYTSNSNCFESTNADKYTLGIQGAWFVGRSRDYFREFENEEYKGYYISNCCGSFILVIKK